MSAEENMELMQTLDDAWNAQDWDTFDSRHAPDVKVTWPGNATATEGRHDHRPAGPRRRDRGPPDRQAVQRGLLHRRALGRRADRRGEPLL